METTTYLQRGEADSDSKYPIQYDYLLHAPFSPSKDSQIEVGEDLEGLPLGSRQFRSQTSLG